MSFECRVEPAVEGDLVHVARHMRPEHVREISDASRLSPLDAVFLCARNAGHAFAGRVDGETLFVCGTERTAILSDAGSLWMFATVEIDRHALAAAAALRDLFGRAHRLAGVRTLEQLVPCWYGKGVKWLRWLGWRCAGVVDVAGTPHFRMMHEEGPQWA